MAEKRELGMGVMERQTERVPSVAGRSYRVLMIAPTSFFADYGCHVRILEECRTLQRMGHQVTVATYHNGRGVDGLEIRRTWPIPWRQHYEVGSSRHKLAFDLLLGLRTVQLLAAHRYDIIHAHLHEGALLGLLAGRLFRVPLVFDFQGSLTEEMIDHRFLARSSPIYPPLRRLERWIDQRAPVVLTSNRSAERLLVEEFGCQPQRIQTLADRVDTAVFCPAAEQDGHALAALRQSLAIPASRRLIVYLGLLAEYQGTGHLLQALRRILERRPDVHLLLMGFPGVEGYRAQAHALGVDGHVTFTGRVPYAQAPRYLALGDVAVAPKLSRSEGAGKLLNYMAVGLPTVAFDTPVAREYLGLDGFYAVRGDVASLAERLLVALAAGDSDGSMGRGVGQRLRQRAIAHFSWDEAGRQIVDVYRWLVGDAPRHTPAAADWAVTRE